ncbi:hypothetical protein WME98_30825 [Sorangium sp. So ce296]|uniref:hypothetical protein n=1 Tax=Sorangium sp. So ce296 TaxID=3133296 RepID=UPI003F62CB02
MHAQNAGATQPVPRSSIGRAWDDMQVSIRMSYVIRSTRDRRYVVGVPATFNDGDPVQLLLDMVSVSSQVEWNLDPVSGLIMLASSPGLACHGNVCLGRHAR